MGKLKQFIVRLYIMIRHPKSVALKRKGIKWDQYCELNKNWIKNAGIKTVLDIGANVGDFAKIIREILPDARIYSFEPLPDCFEKLKNALPGDQLFTPLNMAAGSKKEVLKFYRSFHTPSSSFLQMEDLHKEAFPYTKEGQAVEGLDVNVDTLDQVFSDKKLEDNILLKIDVQGFEAEVLKGASEMLSKAAVIFIEMSFASLYKGLPMFNDIYRTLYDAGFVYKGALAQMMHPETNEVVQMDAIFIKRDEAANNQH